MSERLRSPSIWVAGVGVLVGALALIAWPGHGISRTLGWRELGPAPYVDGYVFEGSGRISSIALHPDLPDTVYVGAATGGVWRCVGKTCVPLTDGLPSASIGALTIDPHNSQVLYAGSGEPTYRRASYYGEGVYKSIDGGASWLLMARGQFAGRTISRIVVSPLDPAIVWMTVMRPGRSNSHPGAEDPEVGLFRSFDGGISWTRIAGLPGIVASDVAIDPVDPNIMYVGLASLDQSGGIYKSSDGGETWAELRSGLRESLGVIEFAISPAKPERVWTITSVNGRPRVYRSDDRGATWVEKTPDELNNYEWYAVAIAVDPKDPDAALVGGVQIFRTRNAGDSYQRVTPIHPDCQAIEFDQTGRALTGTDGGLHVTSDLGSNWGSINDGLGVVQFYPGFGRHPDDPDYFIGGTQDNGTMRRKNGRWTMVLAGDGGTSAIHPDEPDVVFAEIYGTGSLHRSRDGGNNFSQVGEPITGRTPWMAAFTIDPSDAKTIYYGTERLWQSTDQGSRWSAISGVVAPGQASITAIEVASTDPQVIYVSTTDGRLLRSGDRGRNFELKREDLGAPWTASQHIEISPWHADELLVTIPHFGTDQVLRSVDGANTWDVLDGDLQDVPVNSALWLKFAEQEVITLGTDQGMFLGCVPVGQRRAADMHWQRIASPINDAHVVEIRHEPARNILVVETFGRGAWVFDEATPEWFLDICLGTDDTTTSESEGDSGETDSTGPDTAEDSSESSDPSDGSDSHEDSGPGEGEAGDGDGDGDGDDDDTDPDEADDEDPDEGPKGQGESGTGDAGVDSDDAGCGCRQGLGNRAAPAWAWLAWLGGLAWRRRQIRCDGSRGRTAADPILR